MLKIIGVDIDGVITDEGEGEENIWHVEMTRWFGKVQKVLDAYEFDVAYGLPRSEVVKFFEARTEDIIANVPVRPYCRKVLQSLRDAGIRVVLITAREPQYEEVTRRWLEKQKIPYDTLIHATDKAKVCRELGVDLLVDDHVDNCEAVIDAGIPALCFTMDHNVRLTTRAPRVESWKEVACYLASFFGEDYLAGLAG